MDLEKCYVFRDKDEIAGENYQSGLAYCAAGIIESINMVNGEKTPSGKDLGVLYISPFGEVFRGWRTVDEVHLNAVTQADYDYIKNLIESWDEKNG